MGGGFALLTAARGFDAAAPNYGPLPRDLDAALAAACPMVASYGGRDFELPRRRRQARGGARARRRRARRQGVPGRRALLHGPPQRRPLNPFLRVVGIGYHQPSAEDAWGRILRFFDEHLRAPRPE